MTDSVSITGRLTRRLGVIGLIGAAVMIVTLILYFGRADERDLLRVTSANVATAELLAILIMAITIGLMILAARTTAHAAMRPLAQSITLIEQAIGADRGFRLDLDGLPVEVVAFGDAINRLVSQLERVATQREAFAAEAAHELKNPMAVLLLELNAIGHPAAHRLKQNVHAMSRLLDQLLLMARLDSHATSPIESTSIDLAALAARVVESMASVALQENCHLALALSNPLVARGREELLGAALRNLIENAIRVTPPRGVITIRAGPGRQLSVTDGGPGLSDDELAFLRRPFAQSRHASRAGAGLGLAIIDQVATLHQGRLVTHPDRSELQLILNESAPAHSKKFNRG